MGPSRPPARYHTASCGPAKPEAGPAARTMEQHRVAYVLADRGRTTVALAAVFSLYWLVVLRIDTFTDAGSQAALGATTWALLLLSLALSPPRERIQVVTMVVVATGFECFSSLLVGFYRYRLENLPLYVPPGHGLFFLSAVRGAGLPWIERHRRVVIGVVVGCSVVLALRGNLTLATPDLFGLGAWLVFLAFLKWGTQSLFYSVSFALTMVLEFYGTGLGLWAWAPVAPLVGLPAGNPPAGIGAGYCVMDAVARRLAPRVETALSAVSGCLAGGVARQTLP